MVLTQNIFWFSLVFFWFVLVSIAKHQKNCYFCSCLHTYYQPKSKKKKTLCFFVFCFCCYGWYGFKSQTPNRTCFIFEILMDHIYSKKEQLVFFSISETKKTKHLGKTNKTHLLSQNQTLSYFFLFCSIFLFVLGFSIDSHDCHLCPQMLAYLIGPGSQILIKLCHWSACALSEIKPGIGCAVNNG